MLELKFTNAFAQISKQEFESQAVFLEKYQQQFQARNQDFYKLLDDKTTLKDIEQFYKNLDPNIKNIVVIGIGGSALGFKTIHHAFESKSEKRFFVMDNVDPEKIAQVEKQLHLSETLFIVITKSGKTPETMAQYLYFKEKILNKKLDQKDHFVFVTEENSFLHKLSIKEQIPYFCMFPNVGGRFSVLSAVGLLPAKLMGLDITQFINGAKEIRTQFLLNNFKKNTPFQLAALQALYHQKNITNNVFFPYSEPLKLFGDWLTQLLSESTGKQNTRGKSVGITPSSAIGATDQHSSLQLFSDGPKDKLLIFLKVKQFSHNPVIPKIEDQETKSLFEFLENHSFGTLLNAELTGTQQSLTEQGCPHVTIEIEKFDEKTLGALFFLFEASTAFLGEFLEIDAFDQPGVERSKVLTKEILLMG